MANIVKIQYSKSLLYFSQEKRRKGNIIQDPNQDPFRGLEMVNQGTKDLNYWNGPNTEYFMLRLLMSCKQYIQWEAYMPPN